MSEMKHPNHEATADQLAIREAAGAYARNKEIPTFFGQPMVKGSFAQVDPAQMALDASALFYRHPNGDIWIGDAVAWLRSLESESVDLIFADPPYNIKKAEWDSFPLNTGASSSALGRWLERSQTL